MNAIRHIRRLVSVLAGLAGVLLAFGATPAFASIPHPDPGGAASVPPSVFPGLLLNPPVLPPAPGTLKHPPVSPAQVTGPVTGSVHTVVTGGMPGWQIALIAIGAALLAAIVAVLLDRARATRRNAVTAAA